MTQRQDGSPAAPTAGEPGGMVKEKTPVPNNTEAVSPPAWRDHPRFHPELKNLPVDIADQRFWRDVEQLGPRETFELLKELGARYSCRTEIEVLAARYAALDPRALEAAGIYR
jgi:hypothetical protein